MARLHGLALLLITVVGLARASVTLRPVNVTDSNGNFANENNNITWANAPAGEGYKAQNSSFDPGSKAGLYNMVNQFLDVVMPAKELPYDAILGLTKGTMDTMEAGKTLAKSMAGFAIAVIIGIIFIVLMPIIGCCFCCCRLCDNCGGKRYQRKPSAGWCSCFTVTLIILSLFLLAGVLLVFVVNGEIGRTIKNVKPLTTNNLDDVVTFLDNSLQELDFTALGGFKFVSAVIGRDLDNIDQLVGQRVKEKLSEDGGVDKSINNIINYGQTISDIAGQMASLETSQTEIATESDQVKQLLSPVKASLSSVVADAGCATLCKTISPNEVDTKASYNAMPDISAKVTTVKELDKQDVAKSAREGKADFDGIPNKVKTDTATVVSDVKQLLNSFIDTIDSQMIGMKTLPNSVKSPINDVKVKIDNLSGNMATYDRYRFIAGIILALAVLLVLVLQVLGMVFGLIGFNSDAAWHHPTKRSSASNAGGTMLMVSVACVFLYSFLLMLLVTITFFIGGALDKFICEPLMDPEYKAFKKLLDEPGGLMGNDGYFFGKTLLANGSIPLTVSGALQSCKENQGAFTALKLNSLVDLNTITDYKKSINIEDTMNQVNVDLGSVNVISADTEKLLRDFSSTVQLDYASYKTVLNQGAMMTNYHTTVSLVRQASQDAANSANVNLKLTQAADDLDRLTASEVAALERSHQSLLDDVNSLQTRTDKVPTQTNNLITTANTAENYVRTHGTNMVKTINTDFINRILFVADQFSAHILEAVQHDILRCGPIWDIWKSVVHDGICKHVVLTLNGFWFALGWCIFFMVVSLIFNVKLAKYLRRMTKEDAFEGVTLATPGPTNSKPTPPRLGRSNKVEHADNL